jgi:Mce-associated membrane protein
VTELALTSLDGDRAAALVFIDQSATRGDTNKTAAAAGQFLLTAQRGGEVWKITKLDFFNQPLLNGEPAPNC